MTAPGPSRREPPDGEITPAVHARVSVAFCDALSRPVAERRELVESVRIGCTIAGRELERWLEAAHSLGDDGSPGFLASPLVQLDTLIADGEAAASTAEEPHASVPAHIGTFRVLCEVGRGAYARVFLAEQRSPSRHVAVKLLSRGLDGRDVLARFDRERHVLGRLHHRSIASLYEVGLCGGAPYFVMEWVDGAPLVAFAESRSLNLTSRLLLFMQLCRAMQHAHEHGIIHRDLKPSNVLAYESQGELAVKVIDFGVAKAMQKDDAAPLGDLSVHTFTGMLVGTPPYMSPELLEGHAGLADTRCDIYALGVLLYELVTGQRLVGEAGATLADYRRLARDRGSVTLPRGVLGMKRTTQRDLEAIIETAAAPDPERRYRSAGELCEEVEHLLAGRPTRARPIPRSEALRRSVRAHPIATGVVAGAVIALASLIVALSARVQTAEIRAELTASTSSALWSAEQLRNKLGVEKERAALQRSALASARRLAPLADDRPTLLLLARALQGSQEAESGDAERTSGSERLEHLELAAKICEEHLAVRRAIASLPDATREDRAAVAVALVLIGNGQERLERYDVAHDLYSEAMAIENAMLEESPEDPLVLIRLCYSCERLSVLARRRGDFSLERDFNRQRLTIAERLAANEPDDHDAQLNLVEARRFLLVADDIAGATFPPMPDGDAMCAAQLAHTRQLARDNPICMRSQRELAMALAAAAHRLPASDAATARILYLTEANEVLRRALRWQPNDPALLDPLAAVVSDLSQEAEWAGEFESALTQVREQRELLLQLLASRPQEALYRRALAICEQRLNDLASRL
jgi:serine/threonine protein kinase